MCLHCKLWPILSIVEGGETEQRLLVARGVGTVWAPARGPLPQVQIKKAAQSAPKQTNSQWNKRTEAPRKAGSRVWDSYQALSQNHFPGNGNIFVFGKGEGVLRQARAKMRWSLDNCCPTKGPWGGGFKVLLLRPPQWVSGWGTQKSPGWSRS